MQSKRRDINSECGRESLHEIIALRMYDECSICIQRCFLQVHDYESAWSASSCLGWLADVEGDIGGRCHSERGTHGQAKFGGVTPAEPIINRFVGEVLAETAIAMQRDTSDSGTVG